MSLLHVLFTSETASWTTFVLVNHLSRHFRQIKSHIIVDDSSISAFDNKNNKNKKRIDSGDGFLAEYPKLLIISPELNGILDRFPDVRRILIVCLQASPSRFVCVDTTKFVVAAADSPAAAAAAYRWTDQLLETAKSLGVETRFYDGNAPEDDKRAFIESLERNVVDMAERCDRESTAALMPRSGTATREMIASPEVLSTEGDVRVYLLLNTWKLEPDRPAGIDFQFRGSRNGDEHVVNDKNGNTNDDTMAIKGPFYRILNPYTVVVRSPAAPKGIAVITLRQGERTESTKVLYETPAERLAQTLQSVVNPLELFAEGLGVSPSTAGQVDHQLKKMLHARDEEDESSYDAMARPRKSAEITHPNSTLAYEYSDGPPREQRMLEYELRHDTLQQQQQQQREGPPLRFPTLLHFCAAYGLVNSAATLSTLPGFVAALRWPDIDGKTPTEVAKLAGHQRLADFFLDFLEVVEAKPVAKSMTRLEWTGEEEESRAEERKDRYDGDDVDEVCTSMGLVDLEKFSNLREEALKTGNGVDDEDASRVKPKLPPKPRELSRRFNRRHEETDVDENARGGLVEEPPTTLPEENVTAITRDVVKSADHFSSAPVNGTTSATAAAAAIEIHGTRKEMVKIGELLRSGAIDKSQFIAWMDEWNQKTNCGRNFTAGEDEFATVVQVITSIKQMSKRAKEKSRWTSWGSLAKGDGGAGGKDDGDAHQRKSSWVSLVSPALSPILPRKPKLPTKFAITRDPNLQTALEEISSGSPSAIEPFPFPSENHRIVRGPSIGHFQRPPLSPNPPPASASNRSSCISNVSSVTSSSTGYASNEDPDGGEEKPKRPPHGEKPRRAPEPILSSMRRKNSGSSAGSGKSSVVSLRNIDAPGD